MADDNIQNQTQPASVAPSGNSPWDEKLPEEKQPQKQVGNFVNTISPRQDSAAPFKLPQENPTPSAQASKPAPATSTQPQVTSGINFGFSQTPAAPPQPVTPAPAPNIPAPVVPPKPIDSVQTAPKPVDNLAPNAPAAPANIPVPTPVVSPEIVAQKPANVSAAPHPLPNVKTALASSEPKSKRFLLWLIPLILVIIFVLLSYLTEIGVVSLGLEKVYGLAGLEKIWGGLPSSSEEALVKSFGTMKNAGDFKIDGTLYLYVDKTVKNQVTTPLAGFVSAEDKANQSSDPLLADIATTKAINSTFKGSLGANGNDFAIKVVKPIGSEEIDLKSQNSDLWVKSENIKFGDKSASGKWLHYNLSPLKGGTVAGNIFSIDSAKGFSTEGSRDTEERMGGVNCFRYSLKNLQIGDTLSGIGINSDNIQSVSGTVWIGIKDKMMRRLDLNIVSVLNQPAMQIKLSVNLSDFGTTNSFVAPSESEVVSN